MGYGHYFVFGSLAAVGAGLEVVAEALTHEIEASDLLVGYSLAVPVAMYLVVLWLLYIRLGAAGKVRPKLILGVASVVLLIPLASAWVSPVAVTALIAATTAALVAWKTYRRVWPDATAEVVSRS